MELRTKKYRAAYRDQCVALMDDTWSFNKFFPDVKKEKLINELFFEDSISRANYSEVIVDDEENVHGYLFGTHRRSFRDVVHSIWRRLEYAVRVARHYIAGDFGPRASAWRQFRQIIALDEALEAKRERRDGYVALFLVSSVLRGQGWGKRLIQNFESQCAARGHERIYLWTDKGCNYKFYDYNGYTRIYSLSSRLLDGYGEEPNGFVYAKNPISGASTESATA